MKWSDSNFFVSDNVGVLSNCPLAGTTKILYRTNKNWNVSDIKTVYHNINRDNIPYVTMLANGREVKCKINKFNIPANYVITLSNNQKIQTTANHLNKVYGKDYVKTSELTTDDYLPIYHRPTVLTDNMSYEDGKIIGMFLGDGSYRDNNSVTFSLNRDSKNNLIEFLYDYCIPTFNAKISESDCLSEISGKQSCVNITVNSQYMRGLIQQFVEGNSALNKSLNPNFITTSEDFRRGIIDGLYATDGGNSNRIYTSSKPMVETLELLFASLGTAVSINEDNRDGRLGENTCYTVRWYSHGTKTKQKDVYILDDDYVWLKIKNISIINNCPTSYCAEVLDDDAPEEFMLANGIVTHNCRLLSDTTKLDAFINSIGGTALSVGSCRVSTLNLVRIAYEVLESTKDISKAKDKYLKLLKDRTLLDCKALSSMRYILKRNIEKGLLPNYQEGAVEFDKQFCTIGGIGVFEVMDMFGFINTDEFGNKSYTDEGIEFTTQILNTINEVKDNFECDFTFNLEFIPAENAAGNICTADNLLYNGDKYYIYSNQWIPIKEKCTIQEKCKLGSLFDKKCGGGTIAHINVEGRFPNSDVAWDMLNYVAKQGVIYFAFNTKISTCKSRHAFIGTSTCPVCGEPVADTWSRVVG